MDNNEISFENLDYGAYALSYESGRFDENVKYASSDFNRLYVQKLRLPDGKKNIIYLLSDTFENSLKMIDGKNFIIPPSYRQVYYPWYHYGTFMKRRYKVDVKKFQKQRKDLITKTTRFRPYPTRTLGSFTNNIFFSTADLYDATKPILSSFNVKRNYDNFFHEFIELILSLSNTGKKDESNNKNNKNDNNKILIIDANAFKFEKNSSINDNKTNPLFLFYLSYIRNKNLVKMNANIDMLICSGNLFIKFNPSKKMDLKVLPIFRRALFRITNSDMDNIIENSSDEEKNELENDSSDHTLSSIVDDAINPYSKMISPSTKAVLAGAIEDAYKKKASEVYKVDKAIKDTKSSIAKEMNIKNENPFLKYNNSDSNSIMSRDLVRNPLTKQQEDIFKKINGDQYHPLSIRTGQLIDDGDDEFDNEPLEDIESNVKDDVDEIISEDEEVITQVLDNIQDNTVPLKNLNTAPINSPRDQKLREEQKKIVVKNSTIEEILSREAVNSPIETEDHSKVMHTSNENMKKITFGNFEKSYINNLYTKHILSCFDTLSSKNSPFFITGIDIQDSSDSLNLKETWTVHLKDENNKKHTIKVDIPKFQNDRFMWIDGTRWIILKQNFYNPLVKDTPNTVILTTNYNKITITRKESKSIGTVERIFSLIKKTGDSSIFMTGDSSKGNMKYISSLEYDELARRIFKFNSDGCTIYFSRDYINDTDEINSLIPSNINDDQFFIGMEGKTPILINENTGLDVMGRTISDIIESHLSDEYKSIYDSIKTPQQLMYVEGKLAGQFIPVIVTLIVWEGLTKTLQRMGIQWKFDPTAKRVPSNTNGKKYIRFGDGVLEYESKIFAELILNGLSKMHPEKFRFEDFDTENGYSDFIYAQWGSFTGLTELRNFYEFLIDPITLDVCKTLMLPTDPSGLLIHAVKLLSDNTFVSKASDKSYRTRSIEMIPAILYSCIANQYKAYVKSGRRIPMTLKRDCVISKLRAEKTVEAYSTLNPVIEVNKMNTISTKGYKGSNSEHSYDEEKRSYDDSSIGKLAMSTSADANVGINRQLVIEPTISNTMGYRDQVDDTSTLKDVNVFSPVEMLTPGTARYDDPIRTSIACKQSQHVVPVVDATPTLISNGYDEAIQFHLSDDFVINAEEDGKVIDVNEDLGFIVVQYKSGKTRAINIKPNVVKNSNGGFYLSNTLKPTHVKVGETFKKDEPLAYHDKYFRYSKMNGLRYAVGPLVKMAFMSTYNTYEDAGITTEKLGERMKTSIVYKEELGKFKKNNNILYMVNIGDHVNIGDPLIRYDVSTEENELAKFLSKLSEDNAEMIEEEMKNDIKTKHAGKVIDIKVYTLLDPSNLSPSLAEIVKKYFDKGISKKEYLEKFDNSDGIIKAGYMLTDSTEPIKNKYNTIKGIKGIDVLIEIYVEHEDTLAVGDKIVLYTANKQIVSEVIPKGYEPYSEFRPDEEISVLTSPGTIARRMTASVINISALSKVLIELKRKIKNEIKFKN